MDEKKNKGRSRLDPDEKPRVVKGPADLQRLRLEKLMKNPEKPVIIPERPKGKNMPSAPDFVRNVMGSSAGAGSGEFHVYRHLRRKEYSRQKFIQEKGEKEILDDQYHQKLEDNKMAAEQKTAKKRAKRSKKKQLAKNKEKKPKPNQPKNSSEEQSSEEDEEVDGDHSAEKENAQKDEEDSCTRETLDDHTNESNQKQKLDIANSNEESIDKIDNDPTS